MTSKKNMREFISTELKTSLTFAEIALTNPEHTQEETAKARKGYDTTLRFIAEAKERFPDHSVSSSDLEGLEMLKQMLEQLGERL